MGWREDYARNDRIQQQFEARAAEAQRRADEAAREGNSSEATKHREDALANVREASRYLDKKGEAVPLPKSGGFCLLQLMLLPLFPFIAAYRMLMRR